MRENVDYGNSRSGRRVQVVRTAGILQVMADSQPTDSSVQRFQPDQSSERLRDVSFPLAVRGYDRGAVDEFVDAVRALVADLEANQNPEGVVQKALDEVGIETAGILQRAHEAADELASRSRAQADGRLQRAEREAEIVRRDADEYSQQIVVDTRLLWEERQRLIEDIRHLADEVLATADDAMERVKMPELLEPSAEELQPGPSGEQVAGALSLAPEDASGPYALEEVENDLQGDETQAFEPTEPTERYQLGAVDGGAMADEQAPPEFEGTEGDASGGTAELEALPGGGAEAEDDQDAEDQDAGPEDAAELEPDRERD